MANPAILSVRSDEGSEVGRSPALCSHHVRAPKISTPTSSDIRMSARARWSPGDTCEEVNYVPSILEEMLDSRNNAHRFDNLATFGNTRRLIPWQNLEDTLIRSPNATERAS